MLLAEWLPRGSRADSDDAGGDADKLLAGADRAALVTVTRYTAQGSAETASAAPTWSWPATTAGCTSSTAIPAIMARWPPAPQGGKDVRSTLTDLLA